MADVTLEIGLELSNLNQRLDRLETNVSKAGDRSGKAFSDNFRSNLLGIFAGSVLANAATAAFRSVANSITSTLTEGIAAAQVQEDAVNSLNNALRTSGDFSIEASRRFQDFASELQRVTRFGDEVVLSQLALAKSFGASNAQAEQILKASADLSAAFGIDLTSATRNVAKTLGGFAGELGEVIPELKNLDSAALQSGAGIELLANRFSGAAARDVLTFSGAIDQLSNSYGDFLERTGEAITQNPIIIAFINKLTKSFEGLNSRVADFIKSIDLIDDVLTPLANVAEGINNFIIAPLEVGIQVFKVTRDSLIALVSGIVGGFGSIAGAAGRLVAFFKPDSELATNLMNFAESSKEVFEETSDQAITSMRTLLNGGSTELSNSLAKQIENFREFNAELKAEVQTQGETLVSNTQNVATQLTAAQKAALEAQKKLTAQAQASAKQANQIINGGLAKGISGGIQNIVESIANGENAFANFGKFILSTFGDLAIQLGTFFIAQGIAIEALNAISGTGAIAAGVGLVALGSILKAFSGGGSSASSSTSSVTGGIGSTATDSGLQQGLAEPDTIEQAAEQQSVTINIEGSLVQQSELGEFLSDTLLDVRDRRGVTLT